MEHLYKKIEHALDETLILIVAVEVLLGFEYRSVLEPGFEKLPPSAQYLKLCGLALLLVALALLQWPTAYHRLVERGEPTPRFHDFLTRVMCLVLLPFGAALALDVYVAVAGRLDQGPGIAAGLGAAGTALWFWYGLEFHDRGRHAPNRAVGAQARPGARQEGWTMSQQQQGGTSAEKKLEAKIKHVLTEARIVIPGVQALLGFQLASVLVEGFDKLPASSQYVHLVSLGFIALSAILLMTPAAYHRIVEQGEDTERFHDLAGHLILAGMVPLALGIAGDFYVVAAKITGSQPLGILLAALALFFFYGLWFGFTLYRRQRRGQAPAHRQHQGFPTPASSGSQRQQRPT